MNGSRSFVGVVTSSTMMNRDDGGPTCWLVKTVNDIGVLTFVVAAWTERSARIQVRKQIGGSREIVSIKPVRHSYAWAIRTSREQEERNSSREP